LFVYVVCDGFDGFCGLFCDAEPPSPLVEGYSNHFPIDSLVFYFALSDSGCRCEDFLKMFKRLLSKSLGGDFNFLSDFLDTA